MRPEEFKHGRWVEWVNHNRTLRGEIVEVDGLSVVIEWLPREIQVFPNIQASGPDMRRILRPNNVTSIRRDSNKGRVTIAVAAAQLGKTPKQVRAMLRAGTLQGLQDEGKWVKVYLDS